MNAELLSSLATDWHRDRTAAATAHVAAARRAHPLSLPKFRVSWTRTTLAAVAGSRRGSSVVIVISATRTS
jgi:hypothetical protein